MARPFVDDVGVSQALRVISMPMPFPILSVLAVVPEEDDASRAKVGRKGYRPAAGVPAMLEPDAICTVLVSEMRDLSPLKGLSLNVMDLPPCAVHRVKHISPGSYSKACVNDDDGAVFFLRPPRPDQFAVVCIKTWAAGDADEFSPTAFRGSRLSSTNPARFSFFAWFSLTLNSSPARLCPPC